MPNKRFCTYIILFLALNTFAFNGTVKFSDEFYAAQKYFYNEAKQKFPKISGDRFYPEIPIRGAASSEDLKKITALQDYFEARRLFLYELNKYPEQIYPEMFMFLNGHPGLSVNAGNKAKLAALEKYFAPFFFAFSNDKHYSFNAEIKQNPCPIIFCMKDEKKNGLSFSITNTSKKNIEFSLNESPALAYISSVSKKPVAVKAGGSATFKLTIDLQKLKKDSTFRVFNLSLSDPSQPKIKIIIPVILLPSKDLLSLPVHVYDFTFSYATFFKHISLQKEKASWPEPCPSSDCSGKKMLPVRSNDKISSTYKFGDLCTIQYYLTTASNAVYNLKTNAFKFYYNETGYLAGEERNCMVGGVEVHCPSDSPNNGKELYGNRKIEFKLFLPPGKAHELKFNLKYADLLNQAQLNSELSWLQDKKLVLVILDNSEKEVMKEFISKSNANPSIKPLPPGTYKISIFPVTEDGKHVPTFNIQHLNHGDKSRFDFNLNGAFTILSTQAKSK